MKVSGGGVLNKAPVGLYLRPALLVQLQRHQGRRALLADRGVAALPEEVAALLLPRHLVLPLGVLPPAH